MARSVLRIHPKLGRIDRVMPDGTVREAVGSIANTGYLVVSVGRAMVNNHRLIWEFAKGPVPKGFEVDHRNRNKVDNRISNLRLVTRSQNTQNRVNAQSNSKTQTKGVCWSERLQKFRVTINLNKKQYACGCYDTLAEACAARHAAEKILYTHMPKETHNGL